MMTSGRALQHSYERTCGLQLRRLAVRIAGRFAARCLDVRHAKSRAMNRTEQQVSVPEAAYTRQEKRQV
jgi:hypothetical protein